MSGENLDYLIEILFIAGAFAVILLVAHINHWKATQTQRKEPKHPASQRRGDL